MATISDGTTTITPDLVLGPYSASQASRNVFHDILGRPDPDVSLAPASLRRGTLQALFVDEGTADAARDMLAAASIYTYVEPDSPTMGMRFALDGDLSVSLLTDDDSYVWTLSIPYREVGS